MIATLLALTALAGGPEPAAPNDNRTAAGVLKGGELTLALELRRTVWHPEGPNRRGLEVYAFAEPGKAAQIPGPLLRVPAGTRIHARVTNPLNVALDIRGLQSRPAQTWDALHVPPGATRDVTFTAGAPGTYYYWATTSDTRNPLPEQGPFAGRFSPDSQLAGAFVVDPAEAQPVGDRILVISQWVETRDDNKFTFGQNRGLVVNSRSWPHTEGLHYTVGDSVRWRLVNVHADVHPMHLHGFYFRVNARGDGLRDNVIPPAEEPHVVTELMGEGATATMTWVPERPGNWLFHCHFTLHFLPSGFLREGFEAKTDHAHGANHAAEGMGGLVVGIEVKPRDAEAAASEPADYRRLRLIAVEDPAAPHPAFGYVLHEPGTPLPARPGAASSVIVLRRGEPVAITVVNQLREPTAVHWHGIELESYFDGVAGYSGAGTRVTPMIAPGGSFEARFTPPRAGTFIYHTHADELRQQPGGLAGALIVLEPGQEFDGDRDRVFLIASPQDDVDAKGIPVNGERMEGSPITLRAGTPYRFRFINITYNRPLLRVILTGADGDAAWRAVAKDGAELSGNARRVLPSNQQISIGETYDFEFTPTAPGSLRLEVWNGARKVRFYSAAVTIVR